MDLAGPYCGDGPEGLIPRHFLYMQAAGTVIHRGGCGGNVRLHFSLKEVEQWNL